MTRKQLVDNVLGLPLPQRAKLARDILASLDGPNDPGAGKAWTREIERRAEGVRAGTVELASWASARKRIAKSLSHRR